jgi:hypothetical protein
MRFTVCPFCGVVSESPHDSQEACIEALQSEIKHTRHALAQIGDSAQRTPSAKTEDEWEDDTSDTDTNAS